MKLRCPNIDCEAHTNPKIGYIRWGYFGRTSDSKREPRFRCKNKACKRTFSKATTSPFKNQKKRRKNYKVFALMHSGVSMRRCAKLLNITQVTVARKFEFMSKYLTEKQQKEFEKRGLHESFSHAQMDELETFEKSKLLPLSVPLLVAHKSRLILGVSVATMPAKGHLVERSLKKYGPREDQRRKAFEECLKEAKPYLNSEHLIIESDQCPWYPSVIKEILPQARHKSYKSRKACVVGLGELKSGGFDPLFSINHSYAMLRANTSRLFRRTWNTTKRKDRLLMHIRMYIYFHNQTILKRMDKEAKILAKKNAC